MKSKYTKRAKADYARRLRKNPTRGERRLRLPLFLLGYRFQQYDKIGLLPDWYSRGYRIAIELDGSVHNSKHQKQVDKRKDKDRRRAGVKTLRYRDKYPYLIVISILIRTIIWLLVRIIKNILMFKV